MASRAVRKLERKLEFVHAAVAAMYIAQGLPRPVPRELPVPEAGWLRGIYVRIAQPVDDLTYRPLKWLLARNATRRQQEQAWEAGFALALGGPRAPWWQQRMFEFNEGNCAALNLMARQPADRRLVAVPLRQEAS